MSLVDGWIPLAAQWTTAALLLAGWWRQPRGRRTRRLLAVVAGGVACAFFARWYFGTMGIASEPAPWQLWLWVGLTAAAVLTAATSWPAVGWRLRNIYVFTASLCLLSVGLTVNTWIGYFPTVATAVAQLTARPLPGQLDWPTVADMQRRSAAPSGGALVAIDTGSHASGFAHRSEYVYLPPAWFLDPRRSDMPVVMMIGGEFTTPADWVRLGRATSTLDALSAQRRGYAPIAVFVDSTGNFGNDTECVNGPRGNAADHLIGDVLPRVAAQFDVRPTGWGVVGFSAGGTCALDLAVMRPDLFSAFVDVAGDSGPNTGTKAQTIDRLFGGDAGAWARFDPATVIAKHGRYPHLAGRFVVPDGDSVGGYRRAAETLCGLGAANGIDCAVVTPPGRHTWPFAADAFAATLPWLTGELSGGPKRGADDE